MTKRKRANNLTLTLPMTIHNATAQEFLIPLSIFCWHEFNRSYMHIDMFYSRLLITPLVSSSFSAASLLSMQNKNQIKQNRAIHHTFTSLHMGFVILYLHFLANTVFSQKPVLYLFQFFADTNLIDHTCILTCTNTTCIVDKTVYLTWHLVSSWIWKNCMVWLCHG
jgi:hypothetical protein